MARFDVSSSDNLFPENHPFLLKEGMDFDCDLNFEGHDYLSWLPERMTIHGNLRLRGTKLEKLPAFIKVYSCVELESVETLTEVGEHICVRGDLDLEGCKNLRHLPNYLTVIGDLFLAGSGIRIVPTGNRIGGKVYNLKT